MKHVFTSRNGDQKLLTKYYYQFLELSDLELTEAYHKQERCGITGVHAQAVYLLALRKVMKERFGKSPVSLEEGQILSLAGSQ